MSILSTTTFDRIDKLAELHDQVVKRERLIEKDLLEETDGIFGLCRCAWTTTDVFQLHQKKGTAAEAYAMLEKIADAGSITKTYESDDCRHYSLRINDIRGCVVIDE